MSEVILGIIIGGVISIAGQVIATAWTSRSAHARWLREQRITAYRAVLTTWSAKYDSLADSLDEYLNPEGAEPPDDYLSSLYDVIWNANLVCSPRTSREAWTAYKALLAVMGAPSKKGWEALHRADVAFHGMREAMRDDLGVRGDAPPPDFND